MSWHVIAHNCNYSVVTSECTPPGRNLTVVPCRVPDAAAAAAAAVDDDDDGAG